MKKILSVILACCILWGCGRGYGQPKIITSIGKAHNLQELNDKIGSCSERLEKITQELEKPKVEKLPSWGYLIKMYMINWVLFKHIARLTTAFFIWLGKLINPEVVHRAKGMGITKL
jgi:hypothetical protein